MPTITEALAEIKTLKKRLVKKRQFVTTNLYLQGHLKDPLEKEGGSESAIAEARQSIMDLEVRVVKLRLAIARANDGNLVEAGSRSMPISAWLIWKRDVAPDRGQFLEQMRAELFALRRQVAKKGAAIVDGEANDNTQVSVYINEKELAEQIEEHEKILGELDGKLSMTNATAQIEV